MKKVLVAVAAVLALTTLPGAPAFAQGGAQCIDVVVRWDLLGGFASASAPYDCDCGPAVENHAIEGGTLYRINMGCPR